MLDDVIKRTFRFKKLTCHRCLKEWIYKGRNQYKASCPKCKTSIVLNRKRQRSVRSQRSYRSQKSKKRELLY